MQIRDLHGKTIKQTDEGSNLDGQAISAAEIVKMTWTTAAARVAHGIAGWTKAAIGIDPAEADVIDARRLACLGDGTPEHPRCEHAVDCSAAWCAGGACCGKLFSGDKTCGCCISKKTTIAGERCPVDKW